MSAKNFRFRSPGVRIEEIDESTFTIPVESEVGPVIVGRSKHGPMLKPVIIGSPDEFVRTFGTPSPGGVADTDLWRGENTTAPDYGAYAALAYLRNSAPVTFIRLGGAQHPTATTTGEAGWQTTNTEVDAVLADNGGAYGLWLFPSGSAASLGQHGTGSLAAVFYIDSGSAILTYNGSSYVSKQLCKFTGDMMTADIKLRMSSSVSQPGFISNTDAGGIGGYKRDVAVNMSPGAGNFIRKAWNTSPIMVNSSQTDTSELHYQWLGETFESTIKSKTTGDDTLAFISPLTNGGASDKGNYRFAFKNAKTGYVFSQDMGLSSSFDPLTTSPQKLFRIVGLTEGSWASKNIKISITNVDYTKLDQDADPYGTFNLEIRSLTDSDDNPVLLESFEGLNLNPRSPNFIGRVVGDQYLKWDDTNNKIEIYGDYPNNSRYIRVELHAKVKNGGADAKLLPFGFMGPARRQKFQIFSGSKGTPAGGTLKAGYLKYEYSHAFDSGSFGSSSLAKDDEIAGTIASAVLPFTASLEWPDYHLRTLASNATRGIAKNAYFGLLTSFVDSGRFPAEGIVDYAYPLDNGNNSWVAQTGESVHTFAFSLDDVKQVSSSADGWKVDASYAIGQRAANTSITATGKWYKSEGPDKATPSEFYSNADGWKTVLDAGFNSFTMPMHGGFDGVDIKQKNPFSITNIGLTDSSAGQGNYAYFSVLTALKMLRDPEFLDFNLAAIPGIVNATLNTALSDHCQERGDALALLDVDSGYRPIEDITPTNLTLTANRGTVSGAVDYRRNSMSSVITSYASTFYPWVDIADGRNNAIVTVPPTVAMMGVFGRVKQTSDVWFAPAGFQRGGLSDGSTGLRVLNVKDRLTSSERDELYDNGINPIANFPAEGIVVFGQKTLQIQRSALDRINVRRLMIYLKRQIGAVARNTLFEQNVKDTWDGFTRSAEDILKEVKDGLGLVDYKFILDETTTTPDLIDQNILYAKLYVKPARSIEFIALDFIITKTGAQFPE